MRSFLDMFIHIKALNNPAIGEVQLEVSSFISVL